MGVLKKVKKRKEISRKVSVLETYYEITEEYLQDDKVSEIHERLDRFRSKPSMKLNQQNFKMEDEEMLMINAKL